MGLQRQIFSPVKCSREKFSHLTKRLNLSVALAELRHLGVYPKTKWVLLGKPTLILYTKQPTPDSIRF